MMRRFGAAATIVGALIISCVVPRPAGSFELENFSWRNKITRDEIAVAGVTNLAEIFTLAEAWVMHTPDGYTWRFAPNGLAGIDQQTWVVLVDGQEMDVALFDANNLQLLPFNIDQVDSVVVVHEPRVQDGAFTDRGLVHFYTNRPREGVMTGFMVNAGNETGDPGPYRYTGLATPNIDRIGPNASLTAGWGNTEAFITGTGVVRQFRFTDAAVRRRTYATLLPPSLNDTSYPLAVADSPALVSFGAMLRAGFSGANGDYRFFAGWGQSHKYYLYNEPFGHESPTKHRLAHVGVDADVDVGPRTALRLRAHYSENRLSEEPNAFAFDYDWARQRTGGWIEARHDQGKWNAAAGLRYDRSSYDTDYQLAQSNLSWWTLYANGQLRRRTTYEAGAGVTMEGGTAAPRLYARAHRGVGLDHELSMALAWSQRLFSEDNSLWYWSERGYNLLDDNGVAWSMDGSVDRTSMFSADLSWHALMALDRRFTATIVYRWLGDMYADQRDFSFVDSLCAFSGASEVRTGLSGHVGGIRVDFPHGLGQHATGIATYQLLEPLSGDSTLVNNWRQVPRHRASYRLTVQPVPNFALWFRVAWQSETDWADYASVDGSECHLEGGTVVYRSTVDDIVMGEIKATKWMWKRRLILDLLGRADVTRYNYNYHPAGARFNPTFFAQLTMVLE